MSAQDELNTRLTEIQGLYGSGLLNDTEAEIARRRAYRDYQEKTASSVALDRDERAAASVILGAALALLVAVAESFWRAWL